jgi:indolepyruvate ferredoxin oxidoreductase beta subunit
MTMAKEPALSKRRQSLASCWARVSFLLAGVGGQGTILASDVLAAVGLHAGYDVKKSEVHGMAQRGGSVTTSVIWADTVYSPLIGPGEADFILALEKLEALRYVELLRAGGVALVNDYGIAPLSVSSGADQYPDDQRLQAVFSSVTPNYYLFPANALAEELGNVRANNVVLLGALSHWLPEVSLPAWLKAVRERVPAKFVRLNEQAFMVGREEMEKLHPCPRM